MVNDDRIIDQTAARCLAVLSATAAVIHFAVSDMHYLEYWAFGVFMITSALLQIGWAAGTALAPRRWMYTAGAVLNAGIVGVYVVTRTIGDVVGPTPHEKEPVGFGDAFCTAVEVGIVVGCLLLLAGKVNVEIKRPQVGSWALGATGTLMAGLLVVALLDGGPEMTMSMGDDSGTTVTAAPAAQAMHDSGAHGMKGMSASATTGSMAALSSFRLKTTSPAGDIVASMSMAGMHMGSGMKMVTAPCSAMPTAAQQAATVQLVNTSWRDAQRFRSLAAAKAAGYVPITPTGLPVVHYINVADYLAVAKGAPVIDPQSPDSLVYANTPHGAVLAATMYLTRPGTASVPQPGGCLTQWHIHTNLCNATNFGNVVAVVHDGRCPAGSVHRVTSPMMHVWYVPIPGGPNAVDAPDAQVVRAAEQVKSPHNAMA